MLKRALPAIFFLMLQAPLARADASVPSVSGDLLLGIMAVVAAVIIWLVIRAALSMSSSGQDGNDDKAGVGILDGIDEDDDRKS